MSGAISNNYMFITVRGINAGTYSAGSEPALGLYTDGIYRGRHGAAIGTYFDLERVEVLKGPQGLLFGPQRLLGGDPRHHGAAEPGPDGGILRGGRRGAGPAEPRGHGKRAAGRPLGPAGGRAAEGRGRLHPQPSRRAEDHLWYDLSAARLSLRHEPDWGDATLKFAYEDRDQSGAIYMPINLDGSWLYGDELTSSGTSGDQDLIETAEATLTVNVDLPGSMTLRSLTGYYSNNFHYREDWDGTPLELGNWLTYQESEYFSQELVLSGDRDRLSWFAGVSLYSEGHQLRPVPMSPGT